MKNLIIVFSILIFISCKQNEKAESFSQDNLVDFKPDSYELKNNNIKQIKGQILYMPIYSNIPHYIDTTNFDMSAFVTFHNTDFTNKVRIQKVQYFDTKGRMVHDFLEGKVQELAPLETKDFYVPYRDKSGIGANFLIEWVSDSLVTEPLVESVTISLKNHYSVAVLSQGKVIKELK